MNSIIAETLNNTLLNNNKNLAAKRVEISEINNFLEE